MSKRQLTIITNFEFANDCKYSKDGSHEIEITLKNGEELRFTCINKSKPHNLMCGTISPDHGNLAGNAVIPDHDLLRKQIRLLDGIMLEEENITINGFNLGSDRFVFENSGLEISDLEGIANLLGAIHDSYHKINEDDCEN